MNMKSKSYPKYTTDQIHKLLNEKCFSNEYKGSAVKQPAFLCPYYIPLSGELGLDWGIIVNLSSPKFGELVFEHDTCSCSNHENRVGNQQGTSWILRKRKKTREK
jgi:hypothetical protein